MTKPKISVLLTLFNSNVEHLEEAVQSILKQTYSDFEFLIIIEYGTDIKIVKLIEEFSQRDKRIVLVKNKEKLGFVNSLNLGIELSKGEYIARMDDDDISILSRFEKQVKLMDSNLNIGVCGTSQIIVTPKRCFKSLKPSKHNDIRAMMVFGYNISHPTVMFRKELFLRNHWKYKNGVIAEDHELWLRIIDKTTFANIPEILLYHRAGFGNSISEDRRIELHKEGRGFARKEILKLGIDIDIDNPILQGSRIELFLKKGQNRKSFIEEAKEILQQIKEKNDQLGIFEKISFNRMINKRYLWLRTTVDKTKRNIKK